MKIDSFDTKDGDKVSVRDFTVLVGANNVGKSQTLRDLHSKLRNGDNGKTVIVSDLRAEIPNSIDEFIAGLIVTDDQVHADHKVYRGITSNLVQGEEVRIPSHTLGQQFNNRTSPNGRQWLLSQFGKYQVAYLDAATRLQIASFAPSNDPSQQAPQRLLQMLMDDEDAQRKLGEAFKDTFNMEVRLDYSMLANLYLRVANEFPEVPDHPTRAKPIMQQFGTLDDQGDGFRSFAGVILSILLSRGRILLLDEPEAFLHPAQARRLGYWVSKFAREADSQIIVATHNAHFLRGVLSGEGEVDVCRLNRKGNKTAFQTMAAEQIENLSSSPLLSSQPVLESIFFRGAVVCEADSDRLYYQAVATLAHDEHEVLFLNAHNKQTLKDVVCLLRAASIPCAAIADIDILNSASDLTNLVESFGCSPPPQEIERARSTIAAEVEGRSDEKILDALQNDVQEFERQLDAGEHSLSGARSALRRIDSGSTRWNEIKRRGIEALDESSRPAALVLLERLAEMGIFVVPVGELESWAELGTRRKKIWIVRGLQALATDGAPEEVSRFIESVIRHARSEHDDS